MAGVRADQLLFEVGEAVVVEVELEELRAAEILGVVHGARVEAVEHLGGGYHCADYDVHRVEALEDKVLSALRGAHAVAAGRPDLGLIPEEVFPAVLELVAVRVIGRRIHAGERRLLGVDRFAWWLGAPLGKIGSRGVEPFRIGVVLASVGERLVVGLDELLPRHLLYVAEADVGLGDVGRVEPVVEAAELKAGREWNADRRIAVAGVFVDARQQVFVGVRRRKVKKVALDLVAAHDLDQVAAGPVRLHGEDIGHAVLVDVAAVVGRLPFKREHAFDIDRDVRLFVARQLRREIGGGGLGLFKRLFRRNVERPLRRPALGLRRRDDPAVKVAVLFGIGIRIVASRHVRRGSALNACAGGA